MKKLLSIFLAAATLFSISSTVAMAVNPMVDTNPTVKYAEYDLEDLVENNSIMLFATTATKDATAGTVSANLLNAPSGTISRKSATFKFTGIPATATIKNIEAWNPSKNNVTQNKFTGAENIRVVLNDRASEWFKYYITPEPSFKYPCSTSYFNGKLANGTYFIEIQARVISNESGFDGFTARGTKVRVTYTV